MYRNSISLTKTPGFSNRTKQSSGAYEHLGVRQDSNAPEELELTQLCSLEKEADALL
jgi:hypothetical protein